jgi:hypothetical protein
VRKYLALRRAGVAVLAEERKKLGWSRRELSRRLDTYETFITTSRLSALAEGRRVRDDRPGDEQNAQQTDPSGDQAQPGRGD